MDIPLDQPRYGIGPSGMLRWLRRYAAFRGRASRSELWWAALALVLLQLVLLAPGLVLAWTGTTAAWDEALSDPGTAPAAPLAAIAGALPGLGLAALGGIALLGVVVPWTAVVWRRLHDAGSPGWLALLLVGAQAVLLLPVPLVAAALPTALDGLRFERRADPVVASWLPYGPGGAGPRPLGAPFAQHAVSTIAGADAGPVVRGLPPGGMPWRAAHPPTSAQPSGAAGPEDTAPSPLTRGPAGPSAAS